MTFWTKPVASEELTELARTIAQRRGAIATTVQDMARLLNISQANVATVRDQPWYKRIWATITRSNKSLAEDNDANLIEVQRLAMGLLTILAEMDESAAKSIACLQHQVRILTWSDSKTKTQLEELTNRCVLRFADHECRINSIEVDVRVLRWTQSRFDTGEAEQYDDMPTAKCLVMMTSRFMELTAFNWDESAVRMLLNTMEDAGVPLDEKRSLRALAADLYEHWVALTAPEALIGSPWEWAIVDRESATVTPVHAVLSALRGFRKTGYPIDRLDHLLGTGIDVDLEISLRDFVRIFLDEGRLARMMRDESLRRLDPTPMQETVVGIEELAKEHKASQVQANTREQAVMDFEALSPEERQKLIEEAVKAVDALSPEEYTKRAHELTEELKKKSPKLSREAIDAAFAANRVELVARCLGAVVRVALAVYIVK
jgi:hypothetical protein